MTITQVHLPRITAGAEPGNLYVRICTTAAPQLLLDAHPVTEMFDDSDDDYATAIEWLDAHPDDRVHMYLYDGDTGILESMIVLGTEPADQ